MVLITNWEISEGFTYIQLMKNLVSHGHNTQYLFIQFRIRDPFHSFKHFKYLIACLLKNPFLGHILSLGILVILGSITNKKFPINNSQP